jgi:hypothetical protein
MRLAVEDAEVEREEDDDEADEGHIRPHLQGGGIGSGRRGRIGGEEKEFRHGFPR